MLYRAGSRAGAVAGLALELVLYWAGTGAGTGLGWHWSWYWSCLPGQLALKRGGVTFSSYCPKKDSLRRVPGDEVVSGPGRWSTLKGSGVQRVKRVLRRNKDVPYFRELKLSRGVERTWQSTLMGSGVQRVKRVLRGNKDVPYFRELKLSRDRAW